MYLKHIYYLACVTNQTDTSLEQLAEYFKIEFGLENFMICFDFTNYSISNWVTITTESNNFKYPLFLNSCNSNILHKYLAPKLLSFCSD